MENPNSQIPNPVPQAQNILKTFTGLPASKNMARLAVIGALVVVLGAGSGFLISKGGVMGLSTSQPSVPGAQKSAKEAGIADEKTFKDTATGMLKEGGVKGEGTHHLERDGGPSQNVYLTSTVIDLQSFVGKKVQVWGQTISAREAGWLMDVGKVKVVE